MWKPTILMTTRAKELKRNIDVFDQGECSINYIFVKVKVFKMSRLLRVREITERGKLLWKKK